MHFKEFIKHHLTAAQFAKLAALMGITQTRCTRMLNEPQRMSAPEIKSIIKIINKPEISPEYLITEFNCGTKVLTIESSKELIANWVFPV